MLRHIGVCIAILGLLAGPAMAADADLPPPDPADTSYRITLEPSLNSTARCLGDISTPLCALETFLACEVIIEMRPNPACAQVGFKLPPPPTGEFKRIEDARPKDPTVYRVAVFYRVHASLWPSPEMVTELKRYYRDWARSGDGLILVRYGRCIVRPDEVCKLGYSGYRMYSMRQIGPTWRVIGQSSVPKSPALRHALMLPLDQG